MAGRARWDGSDEQLRRRALEAREHGVVPVSSFRVGAAVVGSRSGTVYSGCNVRPRLDEAQTP